VSVLTVTALAAWGVIAGIDLVSFLQVMVARPLVAGTVAGVIVGDPTAGVLVGMVLELYALEVLAVGGARYPDFGPAAVAAAVAAEGVPAILIGPAVVVGLFTAYVGDWSILALRRLNTTHVRKLAASLDQGEVRAVNQAQAAGIGRDAVRALLLTALGLLLAEATRHWAPPATRVRELLTAVLVGIGLATALVNGRRLGGARFGLLWVGLGVAGGVAWLLLR
jgi:PTS system mannose-specific IIC component